MENVDNKFIISSNIFAFDMITVWRRDMSYAKFIYLKLYV